MAKVMSGYPFMTMMMMTMMACAMIVTPVTAFMAYDCSNSSNVVEAYSLLEPAPCHASRFEHRYERIGSRTSHSFFLAGSLDARHNCL
jgi:hypothetical protein